MATLKKLLLYLLAGAVLGAVVASLLAPGWLAWYNSAGPGAPPGFDLAPFARNVARSLLQAQLIGAGVGAAAALTLAVLLLRARKTPASSKVVEPKVVEPPM